ncbi:MAG: hypothetical protein RLZZ200_1019 [Pseudomonadota bacterium]|jgi:DHA1 family bicyclomycin/chloramphenicol resistance-like MFS transporter
MKSHPLRLMAVLCTLMGFASISTDFYLPAMPTMARDLHADAGTLEQTVAAYLIGFSLGQLFWGPVGDRFGRKRPIAVGLLFFVIGSAGCAMADSTMAVIVWRVVQACGACAGVVLSRAMVRDLFGPERSGPMMSTLISIMAIAPLIGPLLGGAILAAAGWRAIFWTLVGVGLLTAAGLATIPETLPSSRRAAGTLWDSFRSYPALLVDRRVMACALLGGGYYVGVYAYVAGSPFAFITFHGVSPQAYGLLFALGILGIMAANQLNIRLLRLTSSDVLIRSGTFAAALSGAVLLVNAGFGWGGLWGLVLPCVAYVSASGLLVANSMGVAMGHRPQQAGAVSALLGAAQYGCGVLGSAAVGAFANGTPVPMGLAIALGGAVAWFGATVAMPANQSGGAR